MTKQNDAQNDVDVSASMMRGVIGELIELVARAPEAQVSAAIAHAVAKGDVAEEHVPAIKRLLEDAPAVVEALRHPSKATALAKLATVVAPVMAPLLRDLTPEQQATRLVSTLREGIDVAGAAGTRVLWHAVMTKEKDSPRLVATTAGAIALSEYRPEGAWFAVARRWVTSERTDADEASVLSGAGMLAGECEKFFQRLAPRLSRIILSDDKGSPRAGVEAVYGFMLGEVIEHVARVQRERGLSREEALAACDVGRARVAERFARVPLEQTERTSKTDGALHDSGLYDESPGPGEVDGRFVLDAILLEELRDFAGKDAASALEEIAAKHTKDDPYRWWEPRNDSPPRWAAYVAQVVWAGVLWPRLEKERRKPTALVRAVHQSALEFHSRVPKFQKDKHTLTFEGRELAALYGATFDVKVIERGLELLGSVAAHKLFRWEVITGHDQALRRVPNPHVLDIEGGWSALAEALGLDPRRPNMTANLRAIVHAQAHFAFKFPDGSRGNMLVYNERPAQGRQKARVRIELGSVLLPDYVHQLPKGSLERRLVPLLREPVPLHGRPNEHGEQLTMSLAVLAELRARAAELAENGTVFLSHDDWTKLADRSGLKRSLILPVREKWLAGDGARAMPFLKQPKQDRYTLAEVHRAELEFLVESGKDEVTGSAAGQRAAQKRRGKLRRVGNR